MNTATRTISQRILALLVAAFVAIDIWNVLFPLPGEFEALKRWMPAWAIWPGLATLLLVIYFKPDRRRLSFSGLKNLLWQGISWDSRPLFIRIMSRQDESDPKHFHYAMSSTQLFGFNNSHRPLKQASAYLKLPDGKKIPLRVTTSDPAMDTSETVEVAARTRFQIGGSFGEGMEYSDFAPQFLPAQLVFEWLEGDYRQTATKARYDKALEKLRRQNTRPWKDKF
ncbi:hypothetical protein [Rhodoferax sp. BAB1]|uniref:hypothetical protein n=1 Tax=Rhodoferax sp. BAB1 TaxID=2741720 RepID=UPI0015771929|nr:hypothetical protein [Rhodoferax sp. BAB1]QKO22613.1 hypothetical protein HTY51_12355 [Rhodoferax sp. BAB1]